MTFANRIVPILLLFASSTVTLACAPADDAEAPLAESDAALTQLRAQLDDLTVWIDPVARPVTRDGRRLWVLNGRASTDLTDVFSFVPDDAFATATLLAPRRFELVFDSASEINSMLSGLPLFVRLTPAVGTTTFASVWLAPHFARFSGSSKIFIQAPVFPVWVAGELVYRGRVSTPSDRLSVASSDASEPTVVREAARQFRLDFSFDRLVLAADPPGDALVFTSGSVRKQAGLDFGVTGLALTQGDPYEVWAFECRPEVRACLAALPVGVLDGEACGSYREVLYCGGLPQP